LFAAIDEILQTFHAFPDAVLFINDLGVVVGANHHATMLFKCHDMADLPADHFFPSWSQVARQSRSAFITSLNYYDSSGITRKGMAVIFYLPMHSSEVTGVVFRKDLERDPHELPGVENPRSFATNRETSAVIRKLSL
jgi:hypothetical protein